MRYEGGVLAATKGRLKRTGVDRDERSAAKGVMTESADTSSQITVSAALFGDRLGLDFQIGKSTVVLSNLTILVPQGGA